MHTKTLLILSLLLTPHVASAGQGRPTTGAIKVPEYDLSSPEETLKSAKKWKFKTESKPKDYPTKVAIGYFQVRYHFKEVTGTGKGANRTSLTTTTLRLGDSEYEQLTNQLYAQLQARLEAEGFEVVDRQAVIDSPVYQAIEQDEDVKRNQNRVRYAPTGMKNLPTFSGRPRRPATLAPLNDDLGTDAVVAAFVNIGLCTVQPTKKTGGRSGVYPCLKGDLSMPGFHIMWISPPKKAGKDKPAWITRLYKELELYTYNKRDGLGYDMALIPPAAAGTLTRDRDVFWKKFKLGLNEQSFMEGAGLIYDDAMAMAFAVWESKFGKAREAAGMKRSEVKPPAFDPDFLPELAVVDTAPPEDFVVGPMTGEIRCYYDTEGKGTLLRRAVDPEKGQIIEDVVTFAKGEANFRAATLWTFDGLEAKLQEANGVWAGTASFESDPWTAQAWKVKLAMGTGMRIEADYTVDGGALVSHAVVRISGNESVVDTRLEPIDEAACAEHLAGVGIPSAIVE